MTRKLAFALCVVLLTTGSLFAAPPDRGCATKQLDETEAVALDKQLRKGRGKANVTVPVWVHVLTDARTATSPTRPCASRSAC